MDVRLNRVVLFFAGLCLLLSAALVWAEGPDSSSQVYRKVGGIQGSPAMKRGTELGWDKGYLAGKKELDSGVQPDPSRHQDYNDPEKWYRYEFGQRTMFIRGFRGGFLKGYGDALHQRVRYVSPLKTPGTPQGSTTSAAMTAVGTNPEWIQATRKETQAKKAQAKQKRAMQIENRVISDAL